MQRVGIRLTSSVHSLFPLDEGPRGSQATEDSIAKLNQTHAVAAQIVARLSEITPPAPIRAEHNQLIQGISQLEDELDSLITSLEQGSTTPVTSLGRFPSMRVIGRVTAAISKKGYAIG